MEIICAGINKTSTKSCSFALRELGYKVADYPETLFYLTQVWTDFLDGKVPIERVIEEYTSRGYTVNQDHPGNIYWEELFKASPNAKVILTVRDNVEVWNRSLLRFMDQEFNAHPYRFWIDQRFHHAGWFGRKFRQMFAITDHCFRKSVMRTANWEKHGPFLPAPWKVFWPSRHLANFKDSMIESKAYYEEHNERVIKTVPKHRLLIWNVKDGWEPLCKFLGKEVPNIPIPHVNKTGENFMEGFILNDDFKKEVEGEFFKNIGVSMLKILSIAAIGASFWFYKKRL